MKKASCLTVLSCFLLAGLIAFNSFSYLPNPVHTEAVSLSANDKGVNRSVCDFPIEEQEGEVRTGQKSGAAPLLTYPVQEVSLTTCDKIRFYFAYHIPDFLQDKEPTPIYLIDRSILI